MKLMGSFLWFVAVLLYPCSITGIVCFTSPFFGADFEAVLSLAG